MPIDSKYLASFITGEFYHVYNRCASSKKMFIEDRNYYFFLDLFKKYLISYVDLYAYCLIPNHFHLFFSIKDIDNTIADDDINKTVTNQFRKLFISYTNSINKEHNLHGGIFSTPFKRIMVTSEAYFTQLIFYIHCNAIHHNICNHPSQYKFSSYNSILSDKASLLKRDEVLNWFGGRESFIKYHEMMSREFLILPFYME